MIQGDIVMPKNWYSVQVDARCHLYYNVEEGVATLAPVFHLHQTKLVLQDILGKDIDFEMLNSRIEKLRKQINETYKPDLIDEDLTVDDELRRHVTKEHRKVFQEMQLSLPEHDHQRNAVMDMSSVKGSNSDILMLMSHICGQYH